MTIPEKNFAWLDGFQRVPEPQDYGDDYRRGDLPLALLRHTWEGVPDGYSGITDYMVRHMRYERPHFVFACPLTTRLKFEPSEGSRRRIRQSPAKLGFAVLAQAQPLDGPSFSLRGAYEKHKPAYCEVEGKQVRVETNHAHVWQSEFIGWAADSRFLTDKELEWEVENAWVPQCLAGGIPELRYYQMVGSNTDRIKPSLWMDPAFRKEHNFYGHQHMPYNTHWDPGAYPYAEVAGEVNKRLDEARRKNTTYTTTGDGQ